MAKLYKNLEQILLSLISGCMQSASFFMHWIGKRNKNKKEPRQKMGRWGGQNLGGIGGERRARNVDICLACAGWRVIRSAEVKKNIIQVISCWRASVVPLRCECEARRRWQVWGDYGKARWGVEIVAVSLVLFLCFLALCEDKAYHEKEERQEGCEEYEREGYCVSILMLLPI